MDLKSFVIPETKCPCCSEEIGASTAVTGDQPPKPGDYTICWTCGEVSRFNADGKTLRRVAPWEESKLEPDDLKLLRRIRERIKQRRSMS